MAALAMPVVAQDAVAVVDGEDVYVMTADQTVLFDAWPYERRMAYEGWPTNLQRYYWTLSPDESDGWWMLTDPQRVRVYDMTPEQRAIAWAEISGQMSAAKAANTAAVEARTATNPAPRFVRSEVAQTTPSSAASEGAQPPICSETVTDGCINAWDAGERGAGVKRPLEYWPGRPASQIDQPLPATQAEFESMQQAKEAKEAAASAKPEEDGDS